MNAHETTTDPSTIPQIIPGYECVERIGAGGYGEVWKVRAPGGLMKALKLVFGQFDDERAMCELNAVSRMKEVRHPFILSVERVEVVGGRLAIVTELADGSVKERFEACRREGLPGIPRDELIVYLRDAAEALDHLCRAHSLQHLDVKPENLLLVGGRVKVADFGMVKNVQDTSAAQHNSLTPVYAPPELFDGHPDMRSDQYSLAIVYHELLTGSLPFSGRTTAQLAAQHIYGRPVLIRLPVTDQPAIGRALSKDPQQRFPTCVALVDALAAGGVSNVTGATSSTPVVAYSNVAESAPELRSTQPMTTQTEPAVASIIGERSPSHQVRSANDGANRQALKATALPAVDISKVDKWARPTLYIGVGGLGGKTLSYLRRRLRDRFGDRTTASALQTLYIDTNTRAAFDVGQRSESSSNSSAQVIALPLQPSHDYRESSKQLLSWLNRRWLYNIPRSLQTEGIRALGRLAYVDQSQLVWNRISAMLTSLCEPSGVTSSAAVTGIPFVPASPRIFIVASTSGGSGSGMALDIAFGMRQLLAEQNISDENLCVVLAHATDRKAATRDIAIANSYACLQELKYFSRFPFHGGDVTGGFTGLPNTYITHLGDELNDQQFESGAESLADFMYRASVTRAAAFFDACHNAPGDGGERHGPTVRSFAIRTFGAASTTVTSLAADNLCKTFIDQWRGEPDALQEFAPPPTTATLILREKQSTESSRDAAVQKLAEERIENYELTCPGVQDKIDGIVQRLIGGDVVAWVRKTLAKQTDLPMSTPADAALEALFGRLATMVEPYLEQVAQMVAEGLSNWIMDLLRTHELRVRGARVAADWIVEHFRNVRHRIMGQLPAVENQRATVAQALKPLTVEHLMRSPVRESGGTRGSDVSPEAFVARFMQLTVEEIELRAASQVVARVQTVMRAMGDQLMDLRRELSQLSAQFVAAPVDGNSGTVQLWHEMSTELATSLRQALPATLAELERAVGQEFFDHEAGLRQTLHIEPDTRNKLPSALRSAARMIVQRVHKTANQSRGSCAGGASGGLPTLNEVVAPANGRWMEQGAIRKLVVLPSANALAQQSGELERNMGGECSLVVDPNEDPMVCIEAEQIPLRDVLDLLAEGRADIPQVAERLHTRIDVNWGGDLD